MRAHTELPAKAARLVASLAIVSALSTKAAHAYIDPGTGSYVLQVVAAVGAGGAVGLP